MKYVDGFVIPVPTKGIATYKKMASLGAKVWMDHGALDYRECVGEDLANSWGTTFTKQMGVKKGETVVFAWITFKSKAHRNKVNAAVMKDPRMKDPMKGVKMPFDIQRMVYGGFTVLVDGDKK